VANEDEGVPPEIIDLVSMILSRAHSLTSGVESQVAVAPTTDISIPIRRFAMSSGSQPPMPAVIERLLQAQNQHDLEAFLTCFSPDYQSEQPCHPDRAFGSRDQVRKNWSNIFTSVPDFRSELFESVMQGDHVWTEWRWYGTRTDGTRFEMRGVTIFGIQDDRIRSGRLYMEPVEEQGAGIDASVKEMTHGTPLE
jgi:ketosteroid isomerase-like protein